jgi:hypothetical protein
MIVAALGLAAGCTSDTSTTDADPTVTTDADLPTTSTTEPIDPGRYTKPGFRPPVSLRVGRGWYAVQDVSGFFDVERAPDTLDVVALQFARPTGVDSAAAFVQALRGRNGLQVTTEESVSVGGLNGTRVVVQTTDPRLQAQQFVTAFEVDAGPVSIASCRRLQIDLADTPDGLVAVLLGGSIRRWDATQRVARPVLRSVRFD